MEHHPSRVPSKTGRSHALWLESDSSSVACWCLIKLPYIDMYNILLSWHFGVTLSSQELNLPDSQQEQQVCVLLSSCHTSSSPLTQTGIDVWVLWGAPWIICAQKVLWAGRQFRDKSNKMVESTASWTIYLSGSRDIVFRSGRPARQSPQRSGLYWNFDSVFQSCHFLKSACNKGDGLLRRSRGREGGKYKKVLLEREKRGSEINLRLVIRRGRTHKSWQWSITLIWAAAARLLQAD